MVRDVKFLVYGNGNILYGDEGAYYDRDPLRKIKVKTDTSFQELLRIICTGIRINPTTHQLEVFHRHPIFSKTMGVRAHYSLVPIIDDDDLENLMEMAESMGGSCTQELYVKVHDGSPEHKTPQECDASLLLNLTKKNQAEKDGSPQISENQARIKKKKISGNRKNVASKLNQAYKEKVVHFRSLMKPKEGGFSLKMSKHHTYDEVVERVAHQLGLDDPLKIRLTSHNYRTQQPMSQSIKYRGVEHLSDMLADNHQPSDILYYEILDIPLPELQELKTLKVECHHATKDEVVVHTVRLPKQNTVGDVLNDIKTKVELSSPQAELRLLEVFDHKIYKIFSFNEKIENITHPYRTLRAEEIPEEEKNAGPQDHLIDVYHFRMDTPQNQKKVQNFGKPFLLVIREGETLAEIKGRIQKKLQVPNEEFAKWRFAFFSLGPPDYLSDSDTVSRYFMRRDVYGACKRYLGLEHSETEPKISNVANQVNSKRKRSSKGEGASTKDYAEDLVGSKIRVWWPLDGTYFEGVVHSYDALSKRHKVVYADGDLETLNLKVEKWKFVTRGVGVNKGEEGDDEKADNFG